MPRPSTTRRQNVVQQGRRTRYPFKMRVSQAASRAMQRNTKAKATRAKKSTKSLRAGSQLEKVLALIRARPGIRPSEINRRLKLAQSDAPRAALIKRGLIRKEKDGAAVRYYAV